ncbi:hypothetical protein Mpt1_c13480 [Candidatus Methanoplasma termitum]|uniref:Uncharacterized protein n=2 Tax=Candidatus Methanoplasma termitum TaxID=1577791 RepID=A0A0A7LDQ9_9ARCH|nr:hypothetical protein Mpt1_c13480 [Candidatus Methanoplasma termitum]
MQFKGEGDKMLEILSKYIEESVVDEADEEILDLLVQAKCIEYSLKEGGIVYAKTNQLGKELLSGSQKTTS